MERNNGRQGREGMVAFYFTGTEIPQRNIKTVIGNTGERFVLWQLSLILVLLLSIFKGVCDVQNIE